MFGLIRGPAVLSPVPLEFEDVTLPGPDGIRISFVVPAHRGVFVLGREESGVDALATYALALERPRTGRVLVFGEDPAQLPRSAALAFRRQVGYLPAGNGLLQNLSLQDNIALPLRFGSDLTEHEISGRIRVMLALLRIADVAEWRPAAASEEQRRRAALARALAFDPDLVILEDPFDGLTYRAAAQVLELARGGETSEGSRRTVLITGQYIPERLEPRIDIRYRVVHGALQREG